MMLVQPEKRSLATKDNKSDPVRIELVMPAMPSLPEWPKMPEQKAMKQMPPPSYRFQIIRDEFGQIVEMIATPF